ncbi:hypothetical protein ACWEPC_51750 [Nonomuraea sp. NPDC004297]
MNDSFSFQSVLERIEQAAGEARSGSKPELDANQLITDVATSLRAALEAELATWSPLIRRMVERGQFEQLADALYTADQGPDHVSYQLARYR